jgi:hypothetical protein
LTAARANPTLSFPFPPSRPSSRFAAHRALFCFTGIADVSLTCRRFAAYGDHVLRERWATHPRAGINLTRALFKACAGVVHGTRGGKEFKRLAEAECLGVKQGGGLKDAGGSPSRFGEMMARCASAVHEEDLHAPLRRGGGAVVKTWEANAAEGDDARFGDR